MRTKAKVESLETQVKELNAELNRLYIEKNAIQPGEIALKYMQGQRQFLRDLQGLMDDEGGKDKEIEEMVDGRKRDEQGFGGKEFKETVQEVFRRTVDMMIPEEVVLALTLCQKDALPELRSFFQSQLSPSFLSTTPEHDLHILSHKSALQSSLSQLHSVVDEICAHSQVLHSLLVSLRPLLTARQCGYFALWLHKHYHHLQSETVLNEGRNSMELLQF